MMELVVEPGGQARCIYGEAINLATLGRLSISRASHVEPDDKGQWFAAIIGGPVLGPFSNRSQAVEAELAWLNANWLLTS
ncbi:MAG TPA: hypothetical protein VHV55_03960 [Pirellulales bacterium]|jgi:hypothetical protein|nr:hypothetical protein [Pirellulales bacterium]